jgi:hypothetical protein
VRPARVPSPAVAPEPSAQHDVPGGVPDREGRVAERATGHHAHGLGTPGGVAGLIGPQQRRTGAGGGAAASGRQEPRDDAES